MATVRSGLRMLAASLFLFPACLAELPLAPAMPQPDDRYKTDILLVFPHPDDATLIDGYLARAIMDLHRRVAVVICTTGESGNNSYGSEAGIALGQNMILEARHGLASLGITNVWTVSGRDTPGQNVLWSLGSWNHGRVLGEVVRLVRLTRPEVIITMMPHYVAGENHSDHQAAGVIATEAFDMAGDPTMFPEQVSPPRNRYGMGNLTEGLRPWQAQKIYYFSDAYENYSQYWNNPQDASPFRKNFLDGAGPQYSNTEISPSRHLPYGRLGAVDQSHYLTQHGIGDVATKAVETGDYGPFQQPARFVFGKSLVKSGVTDDIFTGVVPGPIQYVRVRGYEPQRRQGLSFEFGDPWAFYKEFWRAHELPVIAELLPIPEVGLDPGGVLRVPMLLHNDTPEPAEMRVTVSAPSGWVEQEGSARYQLRAGETYPAQATLTAPAADKHEWQEISWTAEANGKPVGKLRFRVLLAKSGGLPQ